MIKRLHITVLLLLALCARSLLPAGVMIAPAQASDTLFDVVICTGAGPQVVSLDADGTPAPPSKSQTLEDGLCAFAAAGAAALTADGPPSLAQDAVYAAVTYTLASALFAETPKPGATSARGPPSASI